MSKYGNKRVVVNGIKFMSKKEAGWYQHLKRLEENGKIRDLVLQPRFKFNCGITYVADFQFFCVDSGKIRVQDVKGFKTQVYKLKSKMMKNCLAIAIEEI